MRRYRWICVYLFAVVPAIAQDNANVTESLRDEFSVAYNLARAGFTNSGGDSQLLRDYSIYPYLEAARLARELTGAGPRWSDTDDAIESFLAQHDGLPVAWNLHVTWLDSLGSRELWEPFQTYYRDNVADVRLRCRNLSSRIALNQLDGIAERILGEWLSPFQLPLECEPVFQWLRDAGPLNDEMTASRVRLLLENGQAAFARIIARPLPEETARPLLIWCDLIERPLATIEAHLANPIVEIDDAMLLEAWSRLARDNPDAALNLYPALIATGGIGQTSPYTLALALGLAWDRRPETLELFASVADEDLDDYALSWLARAALWADDLDLARDTVEKMSIEQRASAQWRYWSARLANERGARDNLYESLIPNDNYFSAAAAARMNDRPQTHHAAQPYDPDTIDALAARPEITRAAELRHVGLPIAASREWRHAYASFDAIERIQSMHLASELDWFDLAIVTATELGVFFDYPLLYPRPYPAEIDAASDEFDVDPSLIYAVLRQESLYRADAVSSANAMGLMQLQRGTARDVARDLSDLSPDLIDPLDPPMNIRLGTARLASMLERYDGHIVPALAAYNAGPSAVDRWLPANAVEGDIWLENIPYNETREYVRRVLWHSVVFEWLDDGHVNAQQWLRDVEPNQSER